MIKLIVDTNKITKNLAYIHNLAKEKNINLFFSIKSIAGSNELLTKVLGDSHVLMGIADSRELNFKINKRLLEKYTKLMMVLPSSDLERAKEIAKYSDITYISETEHIKILGEAAEIIHTPHQVILFFDLLEGREGIKPTETEKIKIICNHIRHAKYLKLIGVATNVGCITTQNPDYELLSQLVTSAQQIEKLLNISLKYVIGGSSNLLPNIQKNNLPPGVNTICVGEAIILGSIPNYLNTSLELESDIFTLFIDVVEIKEIDKINYQMLLNIGKNDYQKNDLQWPPEFNFTSYSSDYTLVRVSQKSEYIQNILRSRSVKVGINYYALPKLMNSKYVTILAK